MIEWFTTIPGILVICGGVLLFIAIILFIAGNKKTKKENNNEVITENVTVPTPEEVNTKTMEEVTVAENNIEVNQPVADIPVEVKEDNVVNNENINFESNQPAVEPEVEMPKPVEENTVVENKIEENQSEEEFEIPFTKAPIEIPTEEPKVYGGQSPVYDFSIPTEKPVSIYGGNDPLEKTQSIPKVEEHHEPYGGGMPEIKIAEPMNVEVKAEEQPAISIPEFNNQPVDVKVEEPKAFSNEPAVEVPTYMEENKTVEVEEL